MPDMHMACHVLLSTRLSYRSRWTRSKSALQQKDVRGSTQPAATGATGGQAAAGGGEQARRLQEETQNKEAMLQAAARKAGGQSL